MLFAIHTGPVSYHVGPGTVSKLVSF